MIKKTAREKLVELTIALFSSVGGKEMSEIWVKATERQCKEAFKLLVGIGTIPWERSLGVCEGRILVDGVWYQKKRLVDRLYALCTNKVYASVDWGNATYVYRHSVHEVGSAGGLSTPNSDQLFINVSGRAVLSITLNISRTGSRPQDVLARVLRERSSSAEPQFFADSGRGGYEGKFTQITRGEAFDLAKLAGLPSPDKDKLLSS